MAQAHWSEIEGLVKHLFEAGMTPDRGDLVDLAYREGVSDDAVDALDTLGPRHVTSLENLKELLTANGALA